MKRIRICSEQDRLDLLKFIIDYRYGHVFLDEADAWSIKGYRTENAIYEVIGTKGDHVILRTIECENDEEAEVVLERVQVPREIQRYLRTGDIFLWTLACIDKEWRVLSMSHPYEMVAWPDSSPELTLNDQ